MRPLIHSLSLVIGLACGCRAPLPLLHPPVPASIGRDSLELLKAAIQYEHNPVVRAEAVEALEAEGSEEVIPWIRTALQDAHPGVRFAACMAVGVLRDPGGEEGVRRCLSHADESVRIAALFALHRLGDSQRTGEIPTHLLESKDAAVRRNAALALGRLGVPSAVKVLARAMNDEDVGVRHHALEAMARLGNPEARQELVFLSNSGVGSDEVFALQALAELKEPLYEDAFRHKLVTAIHLETKLAAARGLGLLGSDDGFTTALRGLDARKPGVDDPQDAPEGQLLRTRQLAAAALGAIGRKEALPALARMMKDSQDPRLQVSAARAILNIQRIRNASKPRNDPGSSRKHRRRRRGK